MNRPWLASNAASPLSVASFVFDTRGIGLSDPVSPSTPPTLERWVDDALAVLDAAGSKRAAVFSPESPVALLLAASHPQRVSSLVMVNGFAPCLGALGHRSSKGACLTLTPLQARGARTVAGCPNRRTSLAGGGALVALGIVDRLTRDLDFFAAQPDAVERLGPALERALRAQGLQVEVRRMVPGFAHLGPPSGHW